MECARVTLVPFSCWSIATWSSFENWVSVLEIILLLNLQTIKCKIYKPRLIFPAQLGLWNCKRSLFVSSQAFQCYSVQQGFWTWNWIQTKTISHGLREGRSGSISCSRGFALIDKSQEVTKRTRLEDAFHSSQIHPRHRWYTNQNITRTLNIFRPSVRWTLISFWGKYVDSNYNRWYSLHVPFVSQHHSSIDFLD